MALTDETPPPRLPRPLDPVEIRVLGALLEKQQATPEYYPLTAPRAPRGLQPEDEPRSRSWSSTRPRSTRRSSGSASTSSSGRRAGRAPRSGSRTSSDGGGSTRATKAVMTLLLLRGEQTPGELRGRSDRLHAFASTGDVEDGAPPSRGGARAARRRAPAPAGTEGVALDASRGRGGVDAAGAAGRPRDTPLVSRVRCRRAGARTRGAEEEARRRAANPLLDDRDVAFLLYDVLTRRARSRLRLRRALARDVRRYSAPARWRARSSSRPTARSTPSRRAWATGACACTRRCTHLPEARRARPRLGGAPARGGRAQLPLTIARRPRST